MKLIMNKLRSQEGASLILALLFFLLCGMVGASVLAAASSNAGRIKERKTEQQEYFTVSSALQLVCNRLVKMEYKPNVSVTENITTDTKGYTYKKTTYQQTSGTVTFDTNTEVNGKWSTILPWLQKELNYLSIERFTKDECNGYHGNGTFQDDDMHSHSTLGGSDVSNPTEHTLKIKVAESNTNLPGDALKELKNEVEIKVRLGKPGTSGEEKYWFFLEAKMVDGKGKIVMKAELKPTKSFPHINDPNTYNGPYPGLTAERNGVKWELVRIYKETFE